ncbi:MAG: hypothetical protein ACPGYT_11535 [Nitrospirales bacterium]
MEQIENQGLTEAGLQYQKEAATAVVSPETSLGTAVVAQGGCACSTNQVESTKRADNFVYVIGKVEPRFPTLSAEKEFIQATAFSDTVNLTDGETMYSVLTKPENRYLARQMCWVLVVEGLDTYILRPQDPTDFSLLIDALKPSNNLDVVIGRQGPLASPEVCHGLTLPYLLFDQLYTFDMDSLIKTIPRPDSIRPKEFTAAAKELFMKVKQMADNAGATDEYRALNYLAVRCPAIYAKTAEAFGQSCSLSKVQVRPSRLSGARKVTDAILSYTNRQTNVIEKYFIRVDVTEEFPFLVTNLSPYYVYDQYP